MRNRPLELSIAIIIIIIIGIVNYTSILWLGIIFYL